MALVRQCVITALGNCLRSPLYHFATLEIIAEGRGGFHFLKQLMHVERRLPVIHSDDNSNSDEIRREWIHEASAKRIVRKRPAKRMNDRVERFLRLPDLLHAKREDLRIVRFYSGLIHPCLRQRAARSLRENCHACGDISGWSITRSL